MSASGADSPAPARGLRYLHPAAGYTDAEYEAELDEWCSDARYDPTWADPDQQFPIPPDEHWLTVRIQCGRDRADDVMDSFSTEAERKDWQARYQAELDRLELG